MLLYYILAKKMPLWKVCHFCSNFIGNYMDDNLIKSFLLVLFCFDVKNVCPCVA